MKKEIFKDYTVFEINSKSELEKIQKKNIKTPYSIRLIEKKEGFIHRTISNFDSNGILKDKTFYLEDENENELRYIEYDSNDNLIRRVEYENYPNGETKWMYVYDGEGNLINKNFFEED